MSYVNLYGFSILSIFLFAGLFFLMKETMRITRNKKSFFIFFTVLMSLLFVSLWNILGVTAENNTLLSLVLVQVIFFGVYFNRDITIIATSFLLLSLFIGQDDLSIALYQFIILFSTLTTTAFIASFNFIKSNGIKIITISIIVLILIPLITFSLNEYLLIDSELLFIYSITYYAPIIFLQFTLFWIIEWVYKHFIALEESSNYDENGYIKIQRSKETAEYLIAKRRIGLASLVIFSNSEDLSFIMEEIKSIDDDSIFVNATTKNCAVFVPLKEGTGEKIKLFFENNDIKSTHTIYGSESVNYYQLINNLSAKLINSSKIYDEYFFTETKGNLIPKLRLAKINHFIKDIKVDFVYSISTPNKTLIPILPDNYFNELDKLSHEDRTLIMSSISNSIIKKTKDYDFDKLLIPLPLISNKNSDISEMVKKIDSKLDIDKIVLEIYADEKFLGNKTIKTLNELDVDFCISNINDQPKINLSNIRYLKARGAGGFLNKDKDNWRKVDEIILKHNHINKIW